jgi:hypothetical protein
VEAKPEVKTKGKRAEPKNPTSGTMESKAIQASVVLGSLIVAGLATLM